MLERENERPRALLYARASKRYRERVSVCVCEREKARSLACERWTKSLLQYSSLPYPGRCAKLARGSSSLPHLHLISLSLARDSEGYRNISSLL